MDLGVIEDDLRKQLVSKLPAESNVTNITYEGPFLVVYSKNPKVLMEDGDIVKNLARSLRKRILIKSDPEIRMDKNKPNQSSENLSRPMQRSPISPLMMIWVIL